MDVLLTVLGVALALVVVAALVTLLAILLGMRSLKRRNRVSPEQPSPAPVTWLASPAATARLHRRLRSAVSVSRMVVARHAGDRDPAKVAELARTCEAKAVALDHQLAAVANLASADRRRFVAQIAADVREVEVAVSRLSVLDADAAAPARLGHQASEMQALAEQLEHLEAARREVRELDEAAGLAAPAPRPSAPQVDPSRLRRGRG